MRKQLFVLATLFSVGLLVLGLWGFYDNQTKNANVFSDNTRINTVDCSGMTVEKAAAALTNEWNSRDFDIKADGKSVGSLTAIEFEYDISREIGKNLVHSGVQPLFTWLPKNYSQLKVPMNISKTNKAFTRQLGKLKFVAKSDAKKTKNAYIDLSTPKLSIVAEVYGNNLDKEKFQKAVLSRIEAGIFNINISKEEFYSQPTILSDDPTLLAQQETYRKYLAFEITYWVNGHRDVLTPKVLKTMLDYQDGTVTVKTDRVRSYIGKLARKYDTALLSKTYLAGGGAYGNINQAVEVQWLSKALKEGKTVKRVPEFIISPRNHSNMGIGSSYVEIDLTKQHLWIYKNGVLALSTPIVTGNEDKGTPTPPGTYAVFYMQRDRVLKGDDWDGTKYETPVAYWMAFNGGIGLHDAPWRYSFGGTIYKYHGSHGCVNMPPRMAAAAYSMLSIGFPVVVHN